MLINNMKDKLIDYGFDEKKAATLIFDYLALFRKNNLIATEETADLYIKMCEASLVKQKEVKGVGRADLDMDAR